MYGKIKKSRAFRILCSLSFLAIMLVICNGCTMTQEEFKEFEVIIKKQNEFYQESLVRLDEETSEQKARNKAMEAEKSFLEERGRLLEKENELLQSKWGRVRAQSRNATANVFSQIIENQDIFFDVRLGNPPHKLEYPEKLPSRAKKLYGYGDHILLIDMGNAIEDDALIQGAEVFSSMGPQNGSSNEFYVAIFRVNEKGEYFAAGISHPLKIKNKGLNYYRFLYAPVEAKAGDRYGLILAPGTSIDYDEADLGSVQALSLKNFSGRSSSVQFATYKPVRRENTQRPGSRSFAYSLLGTSVRKYIFLFNVSEKNDVSRTLKTMKVGFQSLTAEKDFMHAAYLAVFSFSKKTGQLELVTLSDKIDIQESAAIQAYPVRKNGVNGITVQPGDLTALILSPGIRRRELDFESGKYKIFECVFNPIVPNYSMLFNLTPDIGRKDALFKVSFSTK